MFSTNYQLELFFRKLKLRLIIKLKPEFAALKPSE